MPTSTTVASADQHDADKATTPERDGIGLCLSGGGYRATLFHLGSVRRLHELGLFGLQAPHRFRTISSVSGGSITNAQLAVTHPWPAPGQGWIDTVAKPLREFTKKDIRTGPFLKSFLPWKTTLDGLIPFYDEFLGHKMLASIPTAINFVFCATDLAFSANFEFRQSTIGDYQLGHMPTPADWPLAKAVAASACFPPLFNPMKLDEKFCQKFTGGKAQIANPSQWTESIKDLRLTDGGDYDNMGLEPVFKHHRFILVSDAGGVFDFESDKNLLWRIQRYQAVQETQTRYLRRRWLMTMDALKELDAVYWSVSSSPTSYQQSSGGYSKSLAMDVISNIRTDLDAFSDGESAVLQNHGYFLADAAMRTHAPALMPNPIPPPVPPYLAWMPPAKSEAQIRLDLKDSSKRRLFGP